jgi:hypothetical protein
MTAKGREERKRQHYYPVMGIPDGRTEPTEHLIYMQISLSDDIF